MEEKGCVYFFRHVGLTPTKIGYSINQSPMDRFEQFQTYAPYGAQLVGFIPAVDAKALETELHQKFAHARMKGEWFELDEDTIQKTIRFYSNLEDIEAKNAFEIEWAKKVRRDKNLLLEVPKLEIFIKANFLEDKTCFTPTYTIFQICENEFPEIKSAGALGKILSKMGYEKTRSSIGMREWGYKVKVIK